MHYLTPDGTTRIRVWQCFHARGWQISICLEIQTLPHIDFNQDCYGFTIISTLNIYQQCFVSHSSVVFNCKNNKEKIETLISCY